MVATSVSGSRVDLDKLLAQSLLMAAFGQLPFPLVPRQIIWVDGVNGLDTNLGDHPNSAYKTLATAASKPVGTTDGVVIVIMPGHTETVSTAGAMALNKSGVTVIGLGQGANRPTFTFSGVVGASLTMTGASCSIVNCIFLGGIDALTGYIEIDAADCALINCETRDSTGQATDTIVIGGTTASDRFLVLNHVHRGAAAAGADTAISINAGGDGGRIVNPWIDGNFAVSAIENVTGVLTNFSLFGGPTCYMRTRNAADTIFTAVATTTGTVQGPISARLADHAANITEAFVGADMNFYNDIRISNLDGEAGVPTNIVETTDA